MPPADTERENRAPVDGLLILDKPVGPTSHDVVARVRRALHERRIGHTGTLDPGASGVLALVVGRATRLAQFLASDEKAYEALVQLGVTTETDDAEGDPVGARFEGSWPTLEDVHAALETLRGTRLQRPPVYSAKKIDGRRSYALARAASRTGSGAAGPESRQPAPVEVTLHDVTIAAYEGGRLALTLTCSAGFYVRALARDLGERLGTGGHLSGLRRTRSGAATLERAVSLATVEATPARADDALVPMADMLPQLPALRLTDAGAVRARHGAWLDASDVAGSLDPPVRASAGLGAPNAPLVRLLSPTGVLVGIARASSTSGPSPEAAWALHPEVVLT